MKGRIGIRVPPETKGLSKKEGIEPDKLAKLLKAGKVVIPSNPIHKKEKPCAIGEGLRVKINANLGTSRDFIDVAEELRKVRVAVKYGADAVMDLSTGGNIREIRKKIIRACEVPVGPVPIYETVCGTSHKGGFVDMTADSLFKTIEQHAKDGVDFMTVHCGVTKRTVGSLRRHKRGTGVASRGGAVLVGGVARNG